MTRAPICNDCWNSVTPQQGSVCLVCSEELTVSPFTPVGGSAAHPEENLCQACRLTPPAFARAVAYGGYAGTLRSLIHALKYDGITPVADRLGGLLAEAVLKLDAGDKSMLQDLVVIAVPMHASKLKQRGFNHAELLARSAVKALRSCRPEWKLKLTAGVLQRRKATLSQAGLSPHQRRANLRGVFVVEHPESIAGKHVLLIDDIYTTGATARACSGVLRRAEAASVRVATVARPQRENAAAFQFFNEDLPMHEDVAFWGNETTSRAEGARYAANGAPASSRRSYHSIQSIHSIASSILLWGRNVFGQIDNPRS
jgi:ComF family protein